jgi:hypothetical protein
LTPKRAQVGRQLALNEEAGAAVLTELLDATAPADVPDVPATRGCTVDRRATMNRVDGDDGTRLRSPTIVLGPRRRWKHS